MVNQHSIDAAAFREFATEVLRRVGVRSEEINDAVEPLAWASLRGIDTHGIRNFKSYYVDPVAEKRVKAQPDFGVEYETAMSARANGDNGLGLVAACWGMRLAVEKATGAGVGLVCMRNSNHLGAASYFSHMAIRHDMVGMCMSGHLYADGNEVGMPPVFSLQPMFGTNPLSIAVPCGDEPPYVLDMSTSIVPVNRVEMMHAAGESIPRGWCLDATGKPTTDPTAAKIYLPLGGTRELGAHKGYGLAMFVEILTALLSNGWSEVERPAAVDEQGGFAQEKIAHFFGAIQIGSFREPSEFKKGMDAMIESLHRAPAAPDQERVYVPGEIEHEVEQERRRNGIPLSDKEVREFSDLSTQYGVPLDL